MAASSSKSDSLLFGGNEAEDYVDAIMSSQQITRVHTPVHSGRKMNASEPCQIESTVKKARVSAKAKRTLYRNDSNSTQVNSVLSSAGVNVSTNPSFDSVLTPAGVNVNTNSSVEQLVIKLSTDMHSIFTSIQERMDQLESGLEKRIAQKVAQLLDKRVTSEMNRVRKDVENKLESFKDVLKADVESEIEVINAKVESLGNVHVAPQPDISLNVIIRDLPEHNNENTSSKVNSLLRDGLKISGISCANAERKRSENGKQGVVIARFKSKDDKKKVMSKKAELNSHPRYGKVFINNDQSYAERVMANNFKMVLSALNQNDLTVKGSRVVRARKNPNRGQNVNSDRGSDNRGDRLRDQDDTRDNGRDRDNSRSQGDGNQTRHGRYRNRHHNSHRGQNRRY